MYTVILSISNPEHERLAVAIGSSTVAALFKVVQLRSNATGTPIFTDPEHEYTGEDALRHAWAALNAWNALSDPSKKVLPTSKLGLDDTIPQRYYYYYDRTHNTARDCAEMIVLAPANVSAKFSAHAQHAVRLSEYTIPVSFAYFLYYENGIARRTADDAAIAALQEALAKETAVASSAGKDWPGPVLCLYVRDAERAEFLEQLDSSLSPLWRQRIAVVYVSDDTRMSKTVVMLAEGASALIGNAMRYQDVFAILTAT